MYIDSAQARQPFDSIRITRPYLLDREQ